jgi:hypothetical protein
LNWLKRALLFFCSVLLGGLIVWLFSGCGIRGYHFAGGTGDVTHAIEPGARVIVPDKLAALQLTPACDQTLWTHVYHPNRLKIINACITVTGTLRDATRGRQKDGCRHEADGDGHCFLELDPQFASLLLPGNKEAEMGYLVFEPVCRYKVTQKDALSACVHYHQPLVVPPVGSHISLTGALITDLDHQPLHNEIHPVTRLEVLK